jgi:hypothetical protein
LINLNDYVEDAERNIEIRNVTKRSQGKALEAASQAASGELSDCLFPCDIGLETANLLRHRK